MAGETAEKSSSTRSLSSVSLPLRQEIWSSLARAAALQSTGACFGSHEMARPVSDLYIYSNDLVIYNPAVSGFSRSHIPERSMRMENHGFSRRQLARFGLGMAAMAGLSSMPGLRRVPEARAQELGPRVEEAPFSDDSALDSLDKAYSFLN